MTAPRNESPHLVLASGSPRRRELLGRLGLRFAIVPADIEEKVLNGEAPEEHVCRLAREKAEHTAKRIPDRWVLGADTIVVIDGHILGKPVDEAHAMSMLSTLADRTHTVFTGYALVNSGRPDGARVRYVRSDVHIRGLSADEIKGYVKTGEPMDKAGAYAVQGIGSAIVRSISGSYTNVVGLPLCEVCNDLKALGIFDFLGGNTDS